MTHLRPALRTVLVALLMPALAAAAPAPPPTAAGALSWRLVGPFRGGRVLAVAGIPGNASTFYFGSVAGGVWRTDNAGVTWQPLFDDQRIASVGALTLAPSNPEVLWLGTGEADMRSDISFGDGVYRSRDGGRTWQHCGLEDSRHIGRILVDPNDPDTALVAALGHAYGANDERGVYRTTDGGRTWVKVLGKDADTGAVDLAADPGDPRRVFAVLWQARRTPWSQYPPDEGPGSGLYRSDDAGLTWQPVTGGGFPAGPLGRIGVSVVRTAAGGVRVYALVEADEGDGLYRSDDAGLTWFRVSGDPRLAGRGWYFGRVFADPGDADTVYVPNRSLMRSTDGGRTFTVIKGSPGGDDYHFLWIDPTAPARMIVGSDQGAVVSLDGGATWSSWYNQPTAQFYRVATDHRFPYEIYGTQQDSGSVGIRSRGDSGTITYRDWHSVGAGESGFIAPDPDDPDIVYGGNVGAQVFRWDRRTGQSQDVSPWPLSSFGVPLPRQKYRWEWTSALVTDPLDPKTLYFATQVLLASSDGGIHWREVSPDLTGARPGSVAAGSPPTPADAREKGWGVIFSVAPSPIEKGLIWAGTDTGLIHLTRDGGRSWQDVTPPGLAAWSKVTMIEASPFDPGTAYAAVDRHRLDDFAPYLYRTSDYGQTWKRIDHGLEAPAYLHTVRADPGRRGLLYAGSELGVFVSLDDGESWRSLQLNLPLTSVRDLAIEQGDLVAATHGRGFWVLDDLSPLRQWQDPVRDERAHLFAPARATRVRRSTVHETPLPPEEPHGENPPAGAVVDFWLAAACPVSLEIRDAGGHLVRRFASGDRPARPAEHPYFADSWLPRPEVLPARAGMNRFVWDLRYPKPPAAHYDFSIAAIPGRGTVETPEGPLVLPGRYRLRLSAAGLRLETSLDVRQDPRSTVSREALGGQLHLALEMWNAAARSETLRREIAALRSTLGDLEPARKGAAGARLKTLADRLARLEREVARRGFADLVGSVGSADGEPTGGQRQAFAEESAALEREEAAWKEITGEELSAVNAARKADGEPALAAPSLVPPRLEAP